MRRTVLLAFGLSLLAGAAVAQPAPDPVKGKQQFGQCLACHTVKAGEADKIGPNLSGFFGKKAGTNRKAFPYSPALKASKIVWTEKTLDPYLKSPAGYVPGSKMEFVGVTRPETRANIIAYLKEAAK
jgi:cytochrome c